MCKYDLLCVVLKAGINRDVHGVQSIWDENASTEDWGLLLVDADNAFNEMNIITMLLTVSHLWMSGDHFFLNL